MSEPLVTMRLQSSWVHKCSLLNFEYVWASAFIFCFTNPLFRVCGLSICLEALRTIAKHLNIEWWCPRPEAAECKSLYCKAPIYTGRVKKIAFLCSRWRKGLDLLNDVPTLVPINVLAFIEWIWRKLTYISFDLCKIDFYGVSYEEYLILRSDAVWLLQ